MESFQILQLDIRMSYLNEEANFIEWLNFLDYPPGLTFI